MLRPLSIALCSMGMTIVCACARATQPATAPANAAVGVGRLPHLEVDVKSKQVRVECAALLVEAPLEFFCCVTGTNEHESVLRSRVTPSHLHTALLMIGLEPGQPVHYSEAAKKWLPPHGPPLRIDVEFEKNGERVRLPAYQLMRDIRTKRAMHPLTWIFAGSRVMEDGNYAADVTGYLVSIVNFELTVIDVPALVSSANETLEWETNLDVMPEAGTPVTMIIQPAGEEIEPQNLGADAPIDVPVIKIGRGTLTLDDQEMSLDELEMALKKLRQERPVRLRVAIAPDAPPLVLGRIKVIAERQDVEIGEIIETNQMPTTQAALSDVKLDEQKLDRLRQRWEKSVRPHRAALREAAQTQYEVIAELRREQQRLIDEADRIQRLIDELQREFDEMTTPRPRNE